MWKAIIGMYPWDRLTSIHPPPTNHLPKTQTGKVLSVTLTMSLSRLEALVDERAYVHRKLDHLLRLYAQPDKKLCLRVCVCMCCPYTAPSLPPRFIPTRTPHPNNPSHTASTPQWLLGDRREKWRADLKHDIRLLSERLQILNEVVECAQQEVRRLYYGYNDPSNFGLLDIEVVPSGAAGARGGYNMPGRGTSEGSEEGQSPLVRCRTVCGRGRDAFFWRLSRLFIHHNHMTRTPHRAPEGSAPAAGPTPPL